MSCSGDTARQIREIVAHDPRFRPEAYFFTLESLTYALEKNRKEGQFGHIDGRQLLLHLKDHAEEQFGFLGTVVFHEWGLKSTADFGDIVFNLADARLLSKQETDTKDDFADVFEFSVFEDEFHLPEAG